MAGSQTRRWETPGSTDKNNYEIQRMAFSKWMETTRKRKRPLLEDINGTKVLLKESTLGNRYRHSVRFLWTLDSACHFSSLDKETLMIFRTDLPAVFSAGIIKEGEYNHHGDECYQ